MRPLLIGLVVLLATGCEQNGRYQISSISYTDVWRLDTKTGEVVRCKQFPDDAKANCGGGFTAPASDRPFR